MDKPSTSRSIFNEDSSDSSETNSISSCRKNLEALQMLRESDISDKRARNPKSANSATVPTATTSAMSDEEHQRASEIEFSNKNFLDYLTAEENKLPIGGATSFDIIIRLYISWAKRLEKVVPDATKRAQYIRFTKSTIKRISGLRHKVLSGRYLREPSSIYMKDVFEEYKNYKKVENVTVMKIGDIPSSSLQIAEVEQRVGDVREMAYDADTEGSSELSTCEETSSKECVPTLGKEESEESEPSHEQFLLYLSTMENELLSHSIISNTYYSRALVLFLGWARNVENNIEKSAIDCNSLKFRSKFITFTKENVQKLNWLCKESESCELNMLDSVLEGIYTEFMNFREVFLAEYENLSKVDASDTKTEDAQQL